MRNEKLIIPKGDGTLEMAIASLEIYYKHKNWLSNDFYKKKLIDRYPKFEGKDESFLIHKARTAKYFGLIEHVYKSTNELKGGHARITSEGKRFLEGYLTGNKDVLIDTIMDCIEKYTFGRNNYGSKDTNTDVEMPAVLLNACLDLGAVTKIESVAILYYMHNKSLGYQDAIKKIIEIRNNGEDALKDIPSDLTFENTYGDNKPAQLMREINIFEDNKSQYKLTEVVKKRYLEFIKNLKTTISESESKYISDDVPEEDNEVYETYEVYEEDIKDKYEHVLESEDRFVQKIYFGPPGTGKSYNASKEILDHQKKIGLVSSDEEEYNKDYVYRTTIHPEYSHYDLIGNVMPVVEDKSITYDFKPGIFTSALSKALEVPKKVPVYLIIEEISRGNIASVLGDIFQLLDRKEDGTSEYPIDNEIIVEHLITENIGGYEAESEEHKTVKKEIYLPSNFNILGTANTSDQNVFVMDTAFKRRFDFEYVDIDPVKHKVTGQYLNDYKFTMDRFEYSWNDFYMKLNDYIITELDLPEDKQIGQFFIKFYKDSDIENYKQIQNKLLQYLWEDIHLISMTGDSLFKEEYKSFSNLYKSFGNHTNVFDDNFIEKLSKEAIEEGL